MPRSLLEQVQRPASPAPPARRILPLPLNQLHPVLRIAHALSNPLTIPWRIIFDFELVLITGGQGSLSLDNHLFAYQPFDLFLLPPFVPHRFTASGPRAGHIALHFDLAEHVPASSGLATRRPYEIRLPDGLAFPNHTRLCRGHRLLGSFDAILNSWRAPTPLTPLETTTGMLTILTFLLRQTAATTGQERSRQLLHRVIQHLREHSAEPHTVASLAELAGLSPSHFTVLFRRHTGHPPLEYLRRQRIERARKLLANVELSIKQIAHQVGFADAYHFSRVFRQVDGLSPSHYRAALLAARQPEGGTE